MMQKLLSANGVLSDNRHSDPAAKRCWGSASIVGSFELRLIAGIRIGHAVYYRT